MEIIRQLDNEVAAEHDRLTHTDTDFVDGCSFRERRAETSTSFHLLQLYNFLSSEWEKQNI